MWETKKIKVYNKGDVILDTYLVEDIRSGAMGNVYIAEHKKWKIKVAIKAPNEKILSDEGLFNRVLKEADAWIDLGLHPNIAYCYYVRSLDEVPHIFIEYVNGGNLRDWIGDGKCYDLKVGLDMAIQFCHGMEQAHNHGMIHRDIKPANILMTKEGTLKITDFGLVKTSGLDTPYAGVQGGLRGDTQFASVMGTPAYMPPEQYETPLDVDRRTDIFSFGVCMFEMFCGKPPYDQTSAALPAAYVAKMARKTHHEPSQLRRDIPDDLAEILRKCVSLERDERYSFFEELRTDLTLLYRRLFDDNPPHADVETLKLKAAGLNNRGVSYLDLGREEDALKCWEEALRIDPVHFESAYNHGYLKWNKAEMTQAEVLRRLEGCMEAVEISKTEHWTAIAWLYLEMGALEKILDWQMSNKYDDLFLKDDSLLSAFKQEKNLSKKFYGSHTDAINSVAITPDGRFAISGSDDKTLIIWDIRGKTEIQTCSGHTDRVRSVTVTPNSRFALSGSSDQTLKLWEIASGKEIMMLTGHTGEVSCVAITADGKFALSGSADKTIKIWEIATGRMLRTFSGHVEPVSCVSITPDGKFALSGSDDRTLKLWEVSSCKEICTYAGHSTTVNCIAITPDGKVALAGDAASLRLWEIATGKEIGMFTGHTGRVSSVAVTPDGRFAVSGSDDKTIKLWEMATGRDIKTFIGEDQVAGINAVVITPDGKHAIAGAGGWDNTDTALMFWDLSQPTIDNRAYPLIAEVGEVSSIMKQAEIADNLISNAQDNIVKGCYANAMKLLREAQSISGYERNSSILDMLAVCRKSSDNHVKGIINGFIKGTITGHSDSVSSVAVTRDGRFALSGSDDKTLKLWEIETGKEMRTFTGHTDCVCDVVITPDGRFALSGSGDNTLKLWEIVTGKEIRTFKGHAGRISAIAITPDGRFVLSGSWDHTLILWEIASGAEIRTFSGHPAAVYCVAITPDGRFALSGGDDGAFGGFLRLWDIATGKEIWTFKDNFVTSITSVAITLDGRFALSGSWDRTVKIWEIASGKEIRKFKGHAERVSAVAITPDGRFAISGDFDGVLKLWEIATGTEIMALRGHTMRVTSIAITPDSRFALSGGDDKTIRLWEFDWDFI